MNTVAFKNQSYILQPQETVLQCLLRNEVNYPNSCQAGICQSCLIKAKDGIIQPAWQTGLPETLKAQGYFLACLAKPDAALELASPESSECETSAQLTSLNALSHNVMQVKLQVEKLEHYIPGQYINLINPLGTMRSYSIANLPMQDGFIELHVKIYPGGKMGQWLINAKKHTEVTLRGAFGRCFYYNPQQLVFDMLLSGTGTGLAPLVGIIKSALFQNHQGSITLVHGGLNDEDIYYRDELKTLTTLFPNFTYDPCVLQSQGRYPEESIDKRTLGHLEHPKETRVYVCGPKETTDKLKKQIFLTGVPSQCILSDVFLCTT